MRRAGREHQAGGTSHGAGDLPGAGAGADHPLNNPAWSALAGPHAHVALRRGLAARYPADVSPFAAVASTPGAQDGVDASAWADLAALADPGEIVVLTGHPPRPPAGWEVVGRLETVQFVAGTLEPAPDPDARPLGPSDVPEMLELVGRTRPGPFLPRTIALGRYLGIHRDGTLVAMAGERMRLPGWTEVSAVCTDAPARGQGLAGRLVRAVAAVVTARGDVPFLHVLATNTSAISLYRTLGFLERRRASFLILRVPGGSAAGAPAPELAIPRQDSALPSGALPAPGTAS